MVLYMAFFTYKEIVLAAKDGGYMGKPISDIRDEFNKADFNRKKELCVLYADDERKGVKQLVANTGVKKKAWLQNLNVLML